MKGIAEFARNCADLFGHGRCVRFAFDHARPGDQEQRSVSAEANLADLKCSRRFHQKLLHPMQTKQTSRERPAFSTRISEMGRSSNSTVPIAGIFRRLSFSAGFFSAASRLSSGGQAVPSYCGLHAKAFQNASTTCSAKLSGARSPSRNSEKCADRSWGRPTSRFSDRNPDSGLTGVP